MDVNPNAAAVGFKVKTDKDTTDTDTVTGYTTINANSGAWAGATPSTLCEGDKPGNLVIKYKPTLLLASADDLIFVADKAIFAANAATSCTVTTTNKDTGATETVGVTGAAVTNSLKTLTVDMSAGEKLTLGVDAVVTCTSNLGASPTAGAVTFKAKTTTDTTELTGETGYTTVNDCTDVTSVGGATRSKSLKGAATANDAGSLTVWFVPQTEISIGGEITIWSDQDIVTTGKAETATKCVVKEAGGGQTVTKSQKSVVRDKKDIVLTMGEVVAAGAKVEVVCTTDLAANPADSTVVKISVKTSQDKKKKETTAYTTVAATKVAWVSGEPSSKCAGAKPENLVFKFKPNTEVAADGTLTITADKAIFKAEGATTCTATQIDTATTQAAAAATVKSAAVDATKKILTVTMKTALATLGQEVVVTCTDNLAPITAKDDAVTFDMKTSGDSTATGSQTGYTAIAACQVAFGGAAGKFVFWFTPATALQAADTIVLTSDKDIFTDVSGEIACTATTGGSALALTDADTKKSEPTAKKTMTVKVAGAAAAGTVIAVTCTDQMADNPAAGAVGFQVKTSRGDTTDTPKETGYTTVAAASAIWGSVKPNSLCATVTPANVFLKFTPNTAVAADGTVKLTADKVIFTGTAPTCTATQISPATGAAAAATVKSTAVDADKKVITVTMTTALETLGQEVVLTCAGNLAANAAQGDVVKFAFETSGDTTALAATQTGYTTTAACASSSSTAGNGTTATASSSSTTTAAASASAGNNTAATASATAATTKSTVTQKYTFASLTAAQYTGNTKGNMECAYTCTVENGGTATCTWCVPKKTAPYRDYKTGVAITSSAARRAATVTFVLVVDSNVKSLAEIKTLVAANSDATKYAAALTTVNLGSGLNITSPGAATIAAATFASTASSASTLLPSMLAFVSALCVAFRQM